ncbi:MAG: hypothetical protein R6W81_14980 [Bacteroidales bacterium]
MLEFITLTPELEKFIGSESKDFAVKADRSQPFKVDKGKRPDTGK